ncbi:MAG: tRNA pseudouridine(38-40) synthase TruA [Bacteroidota bacterium]
MRYFMDITYRGTKYSGWQTQSNSITIQGEIEKALRLLLKKETPITGSGRTDAGVHAIQQIAHFDEDSIDTKQLTRKLNSFLPQDIAINSILEVSKESDARFSAISRKYRYQLHQRKDPFREGISYYFNSRIDIGAIDSACEIIKNWKNFECFSRVHTEVNHFNCDIYEANWSKEDGNHLFMIKGNRFLRGMVRTIVGTLIDVGTGKTSLVEFKKILESNDRKKAGRAVPAEGLFFQEVKYPVEIYLN